MNINSEKELMLSISQASIADWYTYRKQIWTVRCFILFFGLTLLIGVGLLETFYRVELTKVGLGLVSLELGHLVSLIFKGDWRATLDYTGLFFIFLLFLLFFVWARVCLIRLALDVIDHKKISYLRILTPFKKSMLQAMLGYLLIVSLWILIFLGWVIISTKIAVSAILLLILFIFGGLLSHYFLMWKYFVVDKNMNCIKAFKESFKIVPYRIRPFFLYPYWRSLRNSFMFTHHARLYRALIGQSNLSTNS